MRGVVGLSCVCAAISRIAVATVMYAFTISYCVLSDDQIIPNQTFRFPKMKGHGAVGSLVFLGLGLSLIVAVHTDNKGYEGVRIYFWRIALPTLVALCVVSASWKACAELLPVHVLLATGHFDVALLASLNLEQERLLPEEGSVQYLQPAMPDETNSNQVADAHESQNLVIFEAHKLTPRFLKQIELAEKQFAKSPHSFSFLVLFWTFNSTKDAAGIRLLTQKFGQDQVFVIDNTLVKEFSPRFFDSDVGAVHVPKTNPIPWLFCQIPILAAVHRRIILSFPFVWFIEYDVSWVGDIAGIIFEFNSQNPRADFIADECKCGMCTDGGFHPNVKQSAAARGIAVGWQGCYIRTPGYIKHKHICGCRGQMVRYSTQILEVLYAHWVAGKRTYCESAPMSLCTQFDWCTIAMLDKKFIGRPWLRHIEEAEWLQIEGQWSSRTKNGSQPPRPGILYHKLKW